MNNDSITNIQATQTNSLTGSSPLNGSTSQPVNGVDALYLAYLYLMELSNTTCHGAVIHSKILNQNALSQQRLDNQGAALQWNYVPNKQVNHHTTYIPHTHWTWTFWNHNGNFEYTTYQKVTWKTYPNATLVDRAQAQNQEITAERQSLGEQLAVLQQIAQVGEASVHTTTDEGMQTMQQAANLLQIAQDLTFQAMLTRQPS